MGVRLPASSTPRRGDGGASWARLHDEFARDRSRTPTSLPEPSQRHHSIRAVAGRRWWKIRQHVVIVESFDSRAACSRGRRCGVREYSAAKEAKGLPAACAAAHAAGQAVATAHVSQHAYGGAYYTLQAVAADCEPAGAMDRVASERAWQEQHLPEPVRSEFISRNRRGEQAVRNVRPSSRDQASEPWRVSIGRDSSYALVVVSASPQTLNLHARRVLAAWAAECAEHVLHVYETVVPGDARVRASIDQARAFAAGSLDVAEAVRRRGGDAGAAARHAPTPAAKAAAYAAEQAAAVAHMGAHALGAAGYAATASALDAGCADDAVARSEAHRQVAQMTDDVSSAISSLPPLGENLSGPLGPGRLNLGHVGVNIREIQRLLLTGTGDPAR